MKVAVVGGRDGVAPELTLDNYVDEFAAALTARGDDVTVYSRRNGRRGGSQCSYEMAEVRVGPAKVLPSSEGLPFIGDFAKSLDSMWAMDPPQVVHAHGWLSGLAAQLAARRRHVPVVQSFHGLATAGDEEERRRLEPLLAKGATWVAAVHSAELSVLARIRHSRDRVSVIPCGVDIERFSPAGPVAERKLAHRILFVDTPGTSSSGFDSIMRAMVWLPDTELVIVNRHSSSPVSEVRSAVHRLASDLQVNDRVRFVGKVRDDDLPALMRSADIVVWTPQSAPSASVALQAMASGVAVIATAVDSLADTVVHGVTGLLVTPGNHRELVSALKTLHTQDFRRRGMGAAGRARVRSRYTWDRVAGDSQVIYHKIVVPDRIDDISPVTG
jgi:glycosyltransferase involved in cell wall biosynthesis